MRAWRTRSRETILDWAPWLTVERHVVELPDGRVIEDWPWVEIRDFVNVVAVDVEGRFLVFEQTKYAVDGLTLAPVGGYLEMGEEPPAAARRELLEETGYESDDWTSLGRYAVDGNRGVGVGHFFLATAVRKVAEPDADDLEEQRLLSMSSDEVKTALREGRFGVVSWAAGFALALLAREHVSD